MYRLNREHNPVILRLGDFPNQEEAAQDPYLCYWSEWYFYVCLAATLTGEEETKKKMFSQLANVHILDAQGSEIETAQVLMKGVLLHENGVSFRTGAKTGLVLTGQYRGLIAYPCIDALQAGRRINPQKIQTGPNSVRANPALMKSLQVYLQAASTILDRALQELELDITSSISRYDLLFERAVSSLISTANGKKV